MATTASVIAAWQDGTYGYASFAVTNDTTINGRAATVEYMASTPLVDGQGVTKPLAQLKAELVQLAKAKRDAQKAAITAVAISGSVNL